MQRAAIIWGQDEWMNKSFPIWVLICGSPQKCACPPVPVLFITAGSFFSCYLICVLFSSGQGLRRLIQHQAWILRQKQLQDETKYSSLIQAVAYQRREKRRKSPSNPVLEHSSSGLEEEAHDGSEPTSVAWLRSRIRFSYPAFQVTRHFTGWLN